MNFTFVQGVFLCMWSCDSFTSWVVCFLCGSRKSKQWFMLYLWT